MSNLVVKWTSAANKAVVLTVHEPVLQWNARPAAASTVLTEKQQILAGTRGVQGPQGAQGEQGVPGPRGPTGSDEFFTYTQATPSREWPITHGLGKFPSVAVVDSAGKFGLGSTRYVDANNLILSFGAPFAGTAYLN